MHQRILLGVASLRRNKVGRGKARVYNYEYRKISILSLSFLVLLHSSTALMASCRFSVATFFSLCDEERAGKTNYLG